MRAPLLKRHLLLLTYEEVRLKSDSSNTYLQYLNDIYIEYW